MKQENWFPVAWMPIYDYNKSKRPTRGYESDPARNMRLFHDCWRHFLALFIEKTKQVRKVVYGDQICRQTHSFVGGLLGDQQVISTCKLL